MTSGAGDVPATCRRRAVGSMTGCGRDATGSVRAMSHLSNVWYRTTDLKIASGSGARVTTVDGVEYLDFTAGVAVTATGHSHPRVVAAIAERSVTM